MVLHRYDWLRPYQVIICFFVLLFFSQANAQPQTALTIRGEPKYKKDFTHFDYVNPEAPKGGSITMAARGTFDSLNPYIEKGTVASGIQLIYDTLMTRSQDEPFSHYPLIAKSYERPSDNTSITFHLNPAARFHDGHPITARDVQYTFSLLTMKGSPFYRTYYNDVKQVNVLSEHSVQFLFKANSNRELPLILSELPVLPAHFWEKPENDFEQASLTFPLGSGPYRIASVEAGKSILYERVKNYWGKDLPVNKGRYNADLRRFDYYRDEQVAIEALKTGAYDLRFENVAKNWAQAYDTPAAGAGLLTKEAIKTLSPKGIQGFVFNLRAPLFSDIRVRQAITYALDFEWLNRNLFYGGYHRANSYFSNSDFAATELPSEEELALLSPFKEQLPPGLFSQPFSLPVTDGSGRNRKQLSEALRLLKQAGWSLKNGKLVNAKNEPLTFELLFFEPSMERVILPFKKNLEQIGITLTPRSVDISQYINRLRKFDFDMVPAVFPQSSNPGNEQRDFWGSEAAAIPGSRNLMGIQSPAIDQLIETIISADTREKLTIATRALDRVLLWGYFLVPHWYLPESRIVYWHQLKRPENTPPLYQLDIDTWWIDPQSTSLGRAPEPGGSKNYYVLLIAIPLAGLAIITLVFIRRRRSQL
ncbi:extracellular solute-binding protein [Candidatus Sororendozoicomonas aggregata]|uniref:extracellular solute-binding protein n=1 Tax=Candidatus Sororendozoicomonas aggregata TaxID=3073239 RepID=UPI002ED27858